MNDRELIMNSIKSVLCSKRLRILYVIDNSPTPELAVLFNSAKIVYMHNPSNPGFGASHNIALKKSIADLEDYHLVINPDVYFNEDVIESIIEFMDRNLNVGHLMPKILFPNGSTQYLCKTNPTIFDLFIRGFAPVCLRGMLRKRIEKYEYKHWDLNKIIYDIPYLSGCFMFFRTDTLREVGLFDESYFMYLEDADITRRFLEVANTVYYPKAVVFHHYAGLTHKSWKYKWITIKSAIIYFNRWGWFKSVI
jgi:GT2 family glycosyltransferase